jgi:hypothetical protein
MAFEHFAPSSPCDREPSVDDAMQLQRRLSALNRVRLAPGTRSSDWEVELAEEYALRRLEMRFVESERVRVQALASSAPRDPDAFVTWFEALEEHGPGQGDPLFPWLATRASLDAMRWFLLQEVAGEAGFEDLVALTQLKMPARPKLELARNYWDEMGRGHEAGMHGPLLERLGEALALDRASEPLWEALALANLMTALASNRCYAFQSIGALGAVELTAPGRAVHVNAGLKRLGIHGSARRYFALHATLDRQHSAAWNSEVLWPLVAANAEVAPLIAEGALLRLLAGQRCFTRYRQQLWVDPRVPC